MKRDWKVLIKGLEGNLLCWPNLSYHWFINFCPVKQSDDSFNQSANQQWAYANTVYERFQMLQSCFWTKATHTVFDNSDYLKLNPLSDDINLFWWHAMSKSLGCFWSSDGKFENSIETDAINSSHQSASNKVYRFKEFECCSCRNIACCHWTRYETFGILCRNKELTSNCVPTFDYGVNCLMSNILIKQLYLWFRLYLLIHILFSYDNSDNVFSFKI